MRLATLAWRGLLARPLRTALAVIGIALGVAVVAATIVIGASSERRCESATADLLGAADVRLRAFADDRLRPAHVQALRAMPAVVAAAPVCERRLTVPTAPGEDERVFTLLVDRDRPGVDAAIREPRLVARASRSRLTSPTDALVPASWAARNGLELGDELRSRGGARGCRRCGSSGSWPTPASPRSSGGDVIVVGRETLDDSFEVPSPIRYVDLDLGDDPTRRADRRGRGRASTSRSLSRPPPTRRRSSRRPRRASSAWRSCSVWLPWWSARSWSATRWR